MSIRAFAAHLGVSDRMVSKWEASGGAIILRPHSQMLLDRSLQNANAQDRERFARLLAGLPPKPVFVPELPPTRPPVQVIRLVVAPPEPVTAVVARTLNREDMRQALAERAIADAYHILARHGVSQRRIAAVTGQSQSEISEILAGRRVVSYDVLTRIADGLGVPRGLMGLAHCVDGVEVEFGPVAVDGHEHPPTASPSADDDKRGLAQ